jgi:hypothetical protein
MAGERDGLECAGRSRAGGRPHPAGGGGRVGGGCVRATAGRAGALPRRWARGRSDGVGPGSEGARGLRTPRRGSGGRAPRGGRLAARRRRGGSAPACAPASSARARRLPRGAPREPGGVSRGAPQSWGAALALRGGVALDRRQLRGLPVRRQRDVRGSPGRSSASASARSPLAGGTDAPRCASTSAPPPSRAPAGRCGRPVRVTVRDRVAQSSLAASPASARLFNRRGRTVATRSSGAGPARRWSRGARPRVQGMGSAVEDVVLAAGGTAPSTSGSLRPTRRGPAPCGCATARRCRDPVICSSRARAPRRTRA